MQLLGGTIISPILIHLHSTAARLHIGFEQQGLCLVPSESIEGRKHKVYCVSGHEVTCNAGKPGRF